MTPEQIRKLAEDCDYPDWHPCVSATLRASADVAEQAKRCMSTPENPILEIRLEQEQSLRIALAKLSEIKP